MKRSLGFFLTVLMALPAMTGYAIQEPAKLSEDQLNEARIKIIALNLEMMRSPDRDRASNLKAFAQEMRKFLKRTPNSEFAPSVQQLLRRVEETLAFGLFRFAQFYADKGNFTEAKSQLRTIIDNYTSFSRFEEVNQLYKALSTPKQPFKSPYENVK